MIMSEKINTSGYTSLPASLKHRLPLSQRKDKSAHILSVSSNLLGICFVVLTSIKVLGKSGETIVDEIAAVTIILFMTSCIISFLSIRWARKKSGWLENIADVIFLFGLSLLFITTILFSFNVIT